MINKIIITIAVVFLAVGCSQKAPDLGSSSNISDEGQISGDAININENGYGSTGANNGKYNSSRDGFKSVYFGFDSYSVSSDMENNIQANANTANATSSRVKVEANCDEFGTDEYNYALGLKRAKAVKDSLIQRGVNANKIVMISFGESNPACSDMTDSCYEQNRRVDFSLIR